MLYCKSYYFFVLNRARKGGRVLFTGSGFFLSFCPSVRGEGLPSFGWSLVFSQVGISFFFHKLLLIVCTFVVDELAYSSNVRPPVGTR